ncbi:acyl-CoA dehydrogenase [Vineibacter terrae]|uniref:Acyl-CoA dehydrogenase n=1 Tax=Vineibacter terrae TaxID=2586908 RepID=A0A5C8PSH5_9HYPH|nr:acyl-CoA dehydrogenase family protein [Vineibacter terrae]TXL78755.1 acyl-CoA dehydrogenase [Vineibacter terrae]
MNDIIGTTFAGQAPVTRARALAPALDAASDDIERTQRIPEPLLSDLHAARLFRMLLPRSVGGDEVEPWVYLRAVEEIARHDGSVGWNIFVANSSALIAPFLPLRTARTIYADARAIIAWGPPNSCRAAAVPGGYKVSGRWDFASGCRQASWMGVHCLVSEPGGGVRLNTAGRPTVRTLLFPATQAELIHTWDVIGLRGTASDSYTTTDLFVPEAFSGTREDPTLRREPGRLYAFTMQGLYAVGVAGVGFGIAGAMLDAFIELAGRKAPRNVGRLADNAVVQSDVARMTAQLDAARAYLVETLSAIWATAGADAPIDLPARARVRLACAHAIHTAEAVADYAYKAAGTDAIFLGTAFERRFRDMHTLSQQIQSRAAHFESVGQVLLGIEPSAIFL